MWFKNKNDGKVIGGGHTPLLRQSSETLPLEGKDLKNLEKLEKVQEGQEVKEVKKKRFMLPHEKFKQQVICP